MNLHEIAGICQALLQLICRDKVKVNRRRSFINLGNDYLYYIYIHMLVKSSSISRALYTKQTEGIVILYGKKKTLGVM